LDRVLASLTSTTRSHAKVLIDQERVHVAGRLQKAGYLVRPHEEIEILELPALPLTATPQEIPLDILYEDDYLAAINKQAGMVVHPAPGQWNGTVVNALLFRWQQKPASSLRPGIVHRLDRDTSGVLLVAKNEHILERLAHQFKDRQVHKTYVAVVIGRFSTAEGEISWPIGRHPTDRKKMSIHARSGRPALSRYQVVAESKGISLVRLSPETGRTHQLRVHLAALGHPIVGDQLYGSARARHELPQVVRSFPRQALHAESLRFHHPVTGAEMKVTAPYPADLAQLLTLFVTAKKVSPP
jgi:23S rRNA pseudouridine1911/1915/1917 synthase